MLTYFKMPSELA